jgi:hypothetical protein
MAVTAALAAAVILAALAVLQVCVACGAPFGRLVWGGAHRVLPRRLRMASALSVLLYAAFAGVLLARAGVLPGGDTVFVSIASWVLVGYFTLGVFMNLISRSPAERWTMTPTCLALALLSLVVALSG